MKKFAIAVTCLLMMTPVAWAGAYVGASLGQSDATSGGASGDETSWKILGGYEFMKHLGVEGSYRNLGSLNETFLTTTIEVDVSSLDVFGVGILPIGEKFDLFAKAGFAFIDVEATISDPQLLGSISASTSETELAYGAGLNFKVGKAAIRAEFETFNADSSFDMISAGGVFRF